MKKNRSKKRWLFKICLLIVCLAILAAPFAINFAVIHSARPYIVFADQVSDVYDCILVLGCSVKPSGDPSDMLRDRLLTGVELYEKGVSAKLLMSGDHGRDDYDEVNAMKSFAVDRGVASSDVFMDHAGFSTYESMYRAKEIFGAKKIVVVTQEYHLYRAVYVARQLGLEAIGVLADKNEYNGQTYRDFREFLARNKDFFTAAIKPEPTYLGEAISVNGNGNITNDR